MRYLPLRPGRLQVHTRRLTRGTSRYVRASLAINAGGPPWHRGLVAVANIGLTVMAGWLIGRLSAPAGGASAAASATYLAAAFGLFFTLSDGEGTLAMRLHAIAWAAAFMAAGSGAARLFQGAPAGIAAAFALLTFTAGVLSWAGLPFFRASRFCVVVFFVVLASDPVSPGILACLLAAAGLIAVIAVASEHALAPDAARTEYSTFAIARKRIVATRRTALRFAVCYLVAAAVGWSAGRVIDETHPTWIAVSVLVVMWPDWQKSYQRVLQRVFGTMVGAIVALGIARFITRPELLVAILLGLCYFVPFGAKRNYWLHCALMALLILLGLDLASQAGFTRHVVAERVADVLTGCSIAILGTLAAFHRRDRKSSS